MLFKISVNLRFSPFKSFENPLPQVRGGKPAAGQEGLWDAGARRSTHRGDGSARPRHPTEQGSSHLELRIETRLIYRTNSKVVFTACTRWNVILNPLPNPPLDFPLYIFFLCWCWTINFLLLIFFFDAEPRIFLFKYPLHSETWTAICPFWC